MIIEVMKALNSKDSVPVDSFYVFDQVVYMLMQYGDAIELNLWTDICYELLRKCPFFRNEIVLFKYRTKLQKNLSHLTGSQLPKMAFILSRAQVPFEEILFRDIFQAKPRETFA